MLSKGSGQGGRDGYVRWVGRVVRLLRTPFALTAKSTNPTYYLELATSTSHSDWGDQNIHWDALNMHQRAL